MDKLVSIISPCYNVEKYIEKYLDSVLVQSYDNIELILVNDGSTDNTEKIIESYEDKFKKRGFIFKHFSQKNVGQAAAINVGLKIFSGDYLMWVDSDDVLLPDNVKKKVEFLEAHPECGFVLCQAVQVLSTDYDTPIRLEKRLHNDMEDNLFSDLIQGNNILWNPGSILVGRKAFLTAIPSRHIYEGREGQNLQLMLPVAYLYKCGYIDEVLLKIVVHSDSHSHKQRSYKEYMQRIESLTVTAVNTIDSIPSMSEENKRHWKTVAEVNNRKQQLMVSCGAYEIDKAKEIKSK